MTATTGSGKRSSSTIPKKFRLPAELTQQLQAASAERGIPESRIVGEALEAYFNPKMPDFIALEMTIAGTLDRLRRAVATLQKDQQITNETLAQFVRLYLSNTAPPSSEEQTKLRQIAPQRFDRFIEVVRSQISGAGYVREVLNHDTE
ncbi:ribbon-helix-helix domain-containing protein [Thalassobaculum litoreum]|uniref:ribbon-helix-helix domain-containing protein n=1 Tax=Thalassobaculum litoreum TaxID=420996 RepID=UPI001113441F|nr:ribbon-helix-helix domain-containing protein [Thalassobaculum litoreum]